MHDRNIENKDFGPITSFYGHQLDCSWARYRSAGSKIRKVDTEYGIPSLIELCSHDLALTLEYSNLTISDQYMVVNVIPDLEVAKRIQHYLNRIDENMPFYYYWLLYHCVPFNTIQIVPSFETFIAPYERELIPTISLLNDINKMRKFDYILSMEFRYNIAGLEKMPHLNYLTCLIIHVADFNSIRIELWHSFLKSKPGSWSHMKYLELGGLMSPKTLLNTLALIPSLEYIGIPIKPEIINEIPALRNCLKTFDHRSYSKRWIRNDTKRSYFLPYNIYSDIDPNLKMVKVEFDEPFARPISLEKPFTMYYYKKISNPVNFESIIKKSKPNGPPKLKKQRFGGFSSKSTINNIFHK